MNLTVSLYWYGPSLYIVEMVSTHVTMPLATNNVINSINFAESKEVTPFQTKIVIIVEQKQSIIEF